MNQKNLQELIRCITREILEEYMDTPTKIGSISDKSDEDDKDISAMTAVEKAKKRREEEKARQDQIRGGKLELNATKKQTDYFGQQLKQNRLKQAAQRKVLQNLQADKDISVGGAGSIGVKI
jgi:hypothetical protein